MLSFVDGKTDQQASTAAHEQKRDKGGPPDGVEGLDHDGFKENASKTQQEPQADQAQPGSAKSSFVRGGFPGHPVRDFRDEQVQQIKRKGHHQRPI